MILHDSKFFKNFYWEREFSRLCFSKTGCSESIEQLWPSCLTTLQKYLMDLWGMACLYKSCVDFHWPTDPLSYLFHRDVEEGFWKSLVQSHTESTTVATAGQTNSTVVWLSLENPQGWSFYLPSRYGSQSCTIHLLKKKCVLMANLSFLSAIWQPLLLPFVTVPLLTFHHCQQEFDSTIYCSSSSSLIFGDYRSLKILTTLTTGGNCSEVESSILSRG